MNNSFVYKWADISLGKFYIGAHKGSPDDGYICSSKIMMNEYNSRPQDFTREILSFHETFQLAVQEEQRLLLEIDAMNNPLYYNQTNGNHKCILLKHSEDTKKKLSERLKGKVPPNKGVPMTTEQKLKISYSKKGKQPWLGKRHSDKAKLKMSMAKKGKPSSKKGSTISIEQKLKIQQANGTSINTPVGIFPSIRAAAQYYRMSATGLKHRVYSPSLKFKEWYPVKKEILING